MSNGRLFKSFCSATDLNTMHPKTIHSAALFPHFVILQRNSLFQNYNMHFLKCTILGITLPIF